MKSLFLDTSEKLVLGILDDNFDWIDYLDTNEKKGSGVLHGILFELLKSNNINIKDISNVFTMAGPGSYTGMRLGEGLAQALELFNIKIYSIYHFDIPKILNVTEGQWFSRAFKGEVFVYSWNGENENYSLLKEEAFREQLLIYQSEGKQSYTHAKDDLFINCEQTTNLIKKNPSHIFKHLYNNNIRKELYYYRPLELEFKQTAI
ncbi:MAG: hypothetical protein HN576_04735 [Bacteriovoracaceae bacterium]|jgi:tRNA threonylcarbamoyladenosine biosynthesis protein TsaB|nr:hypothetical protein [Bacteriovoracaceae bacterium]